MVGCQLVVHRHICGEDGDRPAAQVNSEAVHCGSDVEEDDVAVADRLCRPPGYRVFSFSVATRDGRERGFEGRTHGSATAHPRQLTLLVEQGEVTTDRRVTDAEALSECGYSDRPLGVQRLKDQLISPLGKHE
jgi:hypothetical protein